MNEGQFRGFYVAVEEPGIAWIDSTNPKSSMEHAGKNLDLIETLTQAQMDNGRVVVFTEEDQPFCAGDDLKAYRAHLQRMTPWCHLFTRGMILPSGLITVFGIFPGHLTLRFGA